MQVLAVAVEFAEAAASPAPLTDVVAVNDAEAVNDASKVGVFVRLFCLRGAMEFGTLLPPLFPFLQDSLPPLSSLIPL